LTQTISTATAPHPRRLAIGGLAALLLVAIDQLSKWWIVERVMQPPRVIEVTPFFNIVMVWNSGVTSAWVVTPPGDGGSSPASPQSSW